ncbi:hypothetical protein [Flavobacterium sp.]|uniref:hypothetical protein n=1 Tax=Flavobacterium sp. TaxID=239 RepID=UPI00286CB841|nr:hypothetical protein [Flavobacterium sp.]
MSRVRYVKGNVVEITGGNYKVYSNDNIEIHSGDKIIQTGEEKGVSFGKPKSPPAPEIVAKCVVEFRPHNNWTGEFGFDWMRMADTGLSGDLWYKTIIGKKINDTPSVADEKEYKKLMQKFTVMKVNFTKDFYIIPWLSLYKGKTAKLSLKLNIKESPKKFEFKYDDKLFKLNHTEISKKSKGKHTLPDYLQITCIETFNQDKFIDVLADSQLVGRIKVHKNGKIDRKKLNVLLVKVRTNVRSTPKGEIGDITSEKSKLEKHLRQALITPNVVEEFADLSKDATFNKTLVKTGFITYGTDAKGHSLLHNYMLKNYDFKKKYPNHFIIYVFGLSGVSSGTPAGGEAYDINSDNSVVFDIASRKSTCLVHELLHSLGLYHSFDTSGEFTFKYKQTENIMDYSDTRRTIWKWQWDLIRKHSLVKPE